MFRALCVLMVCLPVIGQAANPKAVLVTGASSGIGRKITDQPDCDCRQARDDSLASGPPMGLTVSFARRDAPTQTCER
jgi:hypothetical protein